MATETIDHCTLRSASAIDFDQLAAFERSFASDPKNRLMQNAVSQCGLKKTALNSSVTSRADNTFSTLLDDWTVTHQRRSGRCWMFAGLNLMRVGVMERLNLKEFEFSQTYTFFWDKLERSNFFLESILQTADRDLDDRTVAWLLDNPLDDGGQWNMFVNLIAKHGVVPKAMMPEAYSATLSSEMNPILHFQLRQGARRLRQAVQTGSSEAEMEQMKREVLQTIYRILSIHLGTPPAEFLWQWNDKDKEFHRDGVLTPQQFAAKYVTLALDDYVCLVHDPRPEHAPGKTYTVDFLGNVVGGDIVTYLNVDIEVMKTAAQKTLENGEPVWMGCDVAPQMSKSLGLWDAQLYDYPEIYSAPFELDKAARLHYHETQMTHAMLFTGVDVVDGKARRWRVENSWGEEYGTKGFFTLNDSWFEEYMFEIAVRKDCLSEELQAAAALDPIVLPPWDPMGALARSGS